MDWGGGGEGLRGRGGGGKPQAVVLQGSGAEGQVGLQGSGTWGAMVCPRRGGAAA